MELRFSVLLDLIRQSVLDPNGAVARLLGLGVPMQGRILGLAIVMVLSAALATLSQMALALATGGQIRVSAASPVVLALMQGALLVYGAWAIAFFGRRMGGRGTFADALLLVVWMEFVLIVGQMVQFVLMFLFPMVGMVLTMVLLGLMGWLLVRFTAALHGFTNLALVALAVVGIFIGSALVIGIVLMSFGIFPVPA